MSDVADVEQNGRDSAFRKLRAQISPLQALEGSISLTMTFDRGSSP